MYKVTRLHQGRKVDSWVKADSATEAIQTIARVFKCSLNDIMCAIPEEWIN